MELKIQLSQEHVDKLLELANGKKEDVTKIAARLLTDLAKCPRPLELKDHKALIGPPWTEKLGTVIDKAICEEYFEAATASQIARVSAVRNMLGVKAFRRQGKPRKYDDNDRIEIWERMKDLNINNTAMMGSLGFRRAKECKEWAESVELPELTARMAKAMKRKTRSKPTV